MAVRHVVAVVQLPPPVTGLSTVNARMVKALEDAGVLLATADMAPAAAAGGAWKLAGRALRTVRAVRAIATARSRGGTVLYMPFDGGKGNALNLVLILTARLCGYAVWTHHHSFAYVNRHSTLVACLLHLAPRGMGHVFGCQEMLERFVARYPKVWAARGHHGVVLSNAFAVETRAPIDRRGDVLKMGHLSRLTVAKGTVRVIELFIALRRGGLAVEAHLVGPIGDAATAAAVARAAQAYPEAFRRVGSLYGEDKAAFYDSLDVFVFPSLYTNEAQPVVLLEALAHGVAVVTTDIGCMGCDHASSPGLTATEADFSAAAYAWLASRWEKKARANLPSQARERFQAMRADSQRALAALIDQL